MHKNIKYLKSKYNKNMLSEIYLTLISTIASNIFTYKTPDFNQTEYDISIQTGFAAFYKCLDMNSVNYGKWCCTPAKNADTVKNDGIADTITTFGSDYSLELKVDEECILIENSSLHFPDFLFCHFAELFSECELSMKALVKWSRMTPIPIVSNDIDIVKYTTVMKNVLDGNEINVISDNTKLLTDKTESIDDRLLRLTDENSIEKMHFFSEYHEQLIRRLCTLGGMPFTTTAKSAQNLQDELHDMDLFSTIYLTDRYNARKQGFERAEKFMYGKYGEKFSFDFDYNDNIKKQLERVKNEIQSDTSENKAGGNSDTDIQSV